MAFEILSALLLKNRQQYRQNRDVYFTLPRAYTLGYDISTFQAYYEINHLMETFAT